jgi:hypothetical protein
MCLPHWGTSVEVSSSAPLFSVYTEQTAINLDLRS